VARQRHGMVIHPHVDGRHAAAELADHRPVGAKIDQRRENASVGEAALQVDHPFLAPGGLEFDAVVVDGNDLEPEPFVVRRPGDNLLDLVQGQIGSGTFDFVVHGVTTTLPKISRSWIRRSPSAACSSGSTLSITGLIWPLAIMSMSAERLSS